MTIQDFEAMTPGTRVQHTRYGPCTVRDALPGFGVVIRPLSPAGQARHQADSGSDVPDHLETVPQRLTRIEEPGQAGAP